MSDDERVHVKGNILMVQHNTGGGGSFLPAGGRNAPAGGEGMTLAVSKSSQSSSSSGIARVKAR